MSKRHNIHGILSRIAPVGIALALAFAAPPAAAYYYGHYGYHHGYGHHYGYPYYGHHYGHHGHGHGYGHHYGYPYYGHHYGHGHHYYHGGIIGLVEAVLSIPAVVVGSLFGYPYHRYPYHEGEPYHEEEEERVPQGVEPGEGGGGYRPESTTPPSTEPGGSNMYDSGSSPGWARLAEGHYSAALTIFGREATSDPGNGGPKVGFALSAAGSGDLSRGVWAMRRALRIDPDAVEYLTIDNALRPRVEHLVGLYDEHSGEEVDETDAAFMLASLHYLLRDLDRAGAEVRLALAAGDHESSTANLKRLVENELDAGGERGEGAERATVAAERDDALLDTLLTDD